MRRLVVAGADTESRDKGGNMAIHLECRDNLLNVLRSLVPKNRGETTMTSQYRNYIKISILRILICVFTCSKFPAS